MCVCVCVRKHKVKGDWYALHRVQHFNQAKMERILSLSLQPKSQLIGM